MTKSDTPNFLFLTPKSPKAEAVARSELDGERGVPKIPGDWGARGPWGVWRFFGPEGDPWALMGIPGVCVGP